MHICTLMHVEVPGQLENTAKYPNVVTVTRARTHRPVPHAGPSHAPPGAPHTPPGSQSPAPHPAALNGICVTFNMLLLPCISTQKKNSQEGAITVWIIWDCRSPRLNVPSLACLPKETQTPELCVCQQVAPPYFLEAQLKRRC